MTAKTTFNPEARTVTFHLENGEITVSFTTFRQLWKNGGNYAMREVVTRRNMEASALGVQRKLATVFA